jgi:hypothetical protein
MSTAATQSMVALARSIARRNPHARLVLMRAKSLSLRGLIAASISDEMATQPMPVLRNS